MLRGKHCRWTDCAYGTHVQTGSRISVINLVFLRLLCVRRDAPLFIEASSCNFDERGVPPASYLSPGRYGLYIVYALIFVPQANCCIYSPLEEIAAYAGLMICLLNPTCKSTPTIEWQHRETAFVLQSWASSEVRNKESDTPCCKSPQCGGPSGLIATHRRDIHPIILDTRYYNLPTAWASVTKRWIQTGLHVWK